MQRLLTILFLACAATLTTSKAVAVDVGVSGLALLPRGQLDENLDNGYGLGAQLLFPLPNSPFLIGGELAIATYSDQRRPFGDDLDVVTSNDIANLDLVLRAQATSGKVRAYADAIIGLKLFKTQSKLVDICDLCEDEVLETRIELDDAAFAYGIGTGLQFQIDDLGHAFIDVGARYTRGRDALYLTRGSIDDANLDERLRESRTDAWSVHIGLMLRL
jgi:hypothetical protein